MIAIAADAEAITDMVAWMGNDEMLSIYEYDTGSVREGAHMIHKLCHRSAVHSGLDAMHVSECHEVSA